MNPNISELLYSHRGSISTKNTYGGFQQPLYIPENIPKLFESFYMVCAYIDNILVMNKNYFAEHLKDPEKFLQKPSEVIFKKNL